MKNLKKFKAAEEFLIKIYQEKWNDFLQQPKKISQEKNSKENCRVCHGFLHKTIQISCLSFILTILILKIILYA